MSKQFLPSVPANRPASWHAKYASANPILGWTAAALLIILGLILILSQPRTYDHASVYKSATPTATAQRYEIQTGAQMQATETHRVNGQRLGGLLLLALGSLLAWLQYQAQLCRPASGSKSETRPATAGCARP